MNRIVGVGSPFGDDQLGWRVAELLKKETRLQWYLGDAIDIQMNDRPGLALVDAMKNVKNFYVIDALQTGQNPVGQLYRMNGESLDADSGFLSTHGFGIAQALALAKALNQLPSKIVIYGIEIGEIDYAAPGSLAEENSILSVPIENACQELARQMTQEILTHA